MLNEDWFATQNPIGTDVLICRPGFTEFALQTHTYSRSFVSTRADREGTTQPNKCTEDDAGNCFMQPTALRERITQ